MSRNPRSVRGEVAWGLVWLVFFTAVVLFTMDPANRARNLAIFLPIAAAVYAVGAWFRLRASRRKREQERPDYRFTRP